MVDVSDARARLRRARERYDAAQAEIERWRRDGNQLAPLAIENPTHARIDFFLGVGKLPPADVMVDLADYFGNLQAALDYAASAVFAAAGGDPHSRQARGVYFPIPPPGGFWDAMAPQVKWAWPEAVEVMGKTQGPQANSLPVLKGLTNAGKHHALYVASLVEQELTFNAFFDEERHLSLGIGFSAERIPRLIEGEAIHLGWAFLHRVEPGSYEMSPEPVLRHEVQDIQLPMRMPKFQLGIVGRQFYAPFDALYGFADQVESVLDDLAELDPPKAVSLDG